MTESRKRSRLTDSQPPDDRRLSDISLTPLTIRELPSERRDRSSREVLLRRVRGEFEALRGLRLTVPQAKRLFGVREDICVRILDALIDEGLLVRTSNGQYGCKHIA